MIELIGRRLGKLTIKKKIPRPSEIKAYKKQSFYLCVCDCGKEVARPYNSIKRYHNIFDNPYCQISCGCTPIRRPSKEDSRKRLLLEVEEIDKNRNESSKTIKKEIMPEISRFLGIVIAMYHNDHEPPHFHAVYGSYKGVFSINDLKLIEGKLPPRVISLILEWAFLHREELLQDWELARKEKPLKKIKPLT